MKLKLLYGQHTIKSLKIKNVKSTLTGFFKSKNDFINLVSKVNLLFESHFYKSNFIFKHLKLVFEYRM